MVGISPIQFARVIITLTQALSSLMQVNQPIGKQVRHKPFKGLGQPIILIIQTTVIKICHISNVSWTSPTRQPAALWMNMIRIIGCTTPIPAPTTITFHIKLPAKEPMSWNHTRIQMRRSFIELPSSTIIKSRWLASLQHHWLYQNHPARQRRIALQWLLVHNPAQPQPPTVQRPNKHPGLPLIIWLINRWSIWFGLKSSRSIQISTSIQPTSLTCPKCEMGCFMWTF